MFIHNINNDKFIITNTTEPVVANYRLLKFSILLSFQILSILCSLFVFINIIYRPSQLLKPINNHFIFVLLITSFIQVSTELSMVENYLYKGIIRTSTNSYCLFFNWYEFSLNGISLFVSKLFFFMYKSLVIYQILVLWATIERHIIIFSNFIFQIRWKRIAFHYLPLSIAILYTPIWYGYLIFIYNCINQWDYDELLCTQPCFYQNKIIGIIDWLFNIIIPAFSIVLANFILIIRVIFRSNRLIDNIERTKKNRKMTLQLLIVSALFLIFWLPIAITGLIQQFFSPTFLIDIQFNIFFYLIYFIQLFLPFICLISLSELKKMIKDKFRQWKTRNIVSNTTTLRMISNIRTAHY